ncbi:hypothetical protein HDR58_08040 [bacterium]|nr:hypothetical protein [bacterium]
MIKFNNINLKKVNNLKGQFSMSIEDNLTDILKKVKQRAEYEISDTCFYRPINEHIQTKDSKIFGRSIAFTITQDETAANRHLLEVSILHPTMMIEIKRPIVVGSKDDIVKLLSQKNTAPNILKEITQMSEKLASQ